MSPSDYILIMTHSGKPRHTTKQKVNCWLKDDTKHNKVCQETVFPSLASKAMYQPTLKIHLLMVIEGDLTWGGKHTHNTVYRRCVIELYNSNPYDFINKCHLNKSDWNV